MTTYSCHLSSLHARIGAIEKDSPDAKHHLFCLGSGSADTRQQYNCNQLLIHRDEVILLDAGATVPTALYNQGLGFEAIDSVLITHLHGDHCYGLERMAYECRFIHKKKPGLLIPNLLIEGLWQVLEPSLGLVGEGTSALSDYFDIYPIEICPERRTGTIHTAHWKIEAFAVDHTPGMNCFGYQINDVLFYSGDIKNAMPHMERMQSAKLCLHDAVTSPVNPVHTSIFQILQYPLEIRRKLWIMGFGDDLLADEDLRTIIVNGGVKGILLPGHLLTID